MDIPLDWLLDTLELANTTARQWTDGNWLRAITSPYNNLLGEGLVGTILAGALILSIYVFSGNIIMPSILVLLLGGVLTTVLPGAIVGIARAMIIVGLATAFLAAARRYVL
jgi:hypothetical protein